MMKSLDPYELMKEDWKYYVDLRQNTSFINVGM